MNRSLIVKADLIAVTVSLAMFSLRKGASVVEAQETATEDVKLSPLQTSMAKLSTLKTTERVQLLKAVDEEITTTQATLLEQLDSRDNETECYAAYLLGRYRFKDAVTLLAEKITLEDAHPKRLSWVWRRFPAMEALARIGEPAVPAMLDHIVTSNDDKEEKLCVLVLRSIEGVDVARFILQKAKDKAKDDAKKAKLQAAFDMLAGDIDV